jgi:molecular chaperone DnaK
VQKRSTDAGTEENSLGFFAFAIDNPRKDYPVEIELAYDLEGIVVITARDPETGQQMRQVMDQDTEALDRALMEQQAWLRKIEVNR